jgi:hypothetical protein
MIALYAPIILALIIIAVYSTYQIFTNHIPTEYIEQEKVQEGYTTIPTHLLPDPDKLDLLAQIFDYEDKIFKDLTGQDRLTEIQDDLRTWATNLRTHIEN